jgi:uncharacterized protein
MLTVTMTDQTTTRAWLHQPASWSETSDTLTVTASPGTDYWQLTHYGFVHDNGPFRYQEQTGNFAAKVRIAARYHELYHQAGLLIRIDDQNWIKAGIEFLNGKQSVSAVVTRVFSDWSVLACSDDSAFLWLRMQRYHDTVQVSYSRDNKKWSMIRLAAAPGKEPLEVTFDHFSIDPLHAPPQED